MMIPGARMHKTSPVFKSRTNFIFIKRKDTGTNGESIEIQKSVKSSIKNLSTSLEEESGIQTDWEEKVKDYVDMVLNEKEKMKRP